MDAIQFKQNMINIDSKIEELNKEEINEYVIKQLDECYKKKKQIINDYLMSINTNEINKDEINDEIKDEKQSDDEIFEFILDNPKNKHYSDLDHYNELEIRSGYISYSVNYVHEFKSKLNGDKNLSEEEKKFIESLKLYNKYEFKSSLKILKELEKLNFSLAINNIGEMYFRGKYLEANHKKAFEYFQKAAMLGNSVAIFNVGYCYNLGFGATTDKDKAIILFKKAADLGNISAKRLMADYMFEIDEISNAIEQYIQIAQAKELLSLDTLTRLITKNKIEIDYKYKIIKRLIKHNIYRFDTDDFISSLIDVINRDTHLISELENRIIELEQQNQQKH